MNKTVQDGLARLTLAVDLRQYLGQAGAMNVQEGADQFDSRRAHDRIAVFLNRCDQLFDALYAAMELRGLHVQSSFFP